MNPFHRINKSIKDYNQYSFSIKRFAVLFQRLNLYIIGVCLLIPAIWFNGFDENFIAKRTQVFNYKERIRAQYDELAEVYDENKRLGISHAKLRGYDEFYQGQLGKYHFRFGFVYGSMALTALPWLLILFWPVGTPIRIDRKRQLIYTRHWFRLYAARFNQLQPEFPEYSALMERAPGPLMIHLYRPGKTHTKKGKLRKGLKIRLGLYYPQIEGQNRELYSLIKSFMEYKIDLPNNLRTPKGWLEYSLVPMRKFPRSQRLNKALDNWWDKEQYPQLCPSIEWMLHYMKELKREGKLLAEPAPISKQSLILGGQQSEMSGIIRDYF